MSLLGAEGRPGDELPHGCWRWPAADEAYFALATEWLALLAALV
jgi:hypothetical protein